MRPLLFGPFRHTPYSDGPGNVEAMLRPDPWMVGPTPTSRPVIVPPEQARGLPPERVWGIWIDSQIATLPHRITIGRDAARAVGRGLAIYTDDATFDDRVRAKLERGDSIWLQAYRHSTEPYIDFERRVHGELLRLARWGYPVGIVLGVSGVTARAMTPLQVYENLHLLTWLIANVPNVLDEFIGCLYWAVGRDTAVDGAIAPMLSAFWRSCQWPLPAPGAPAVAWMDMLNEVAGR